MTKAHWLVASACLALIALPVRAQSFDIDAYIDNANVLVGDEYRDFCSGTIIDIEQRLVLTAYHCLQGKVIREEKEFVDPDTGEVTKKTIERKLEMVVAQNVTKDFEKIARRSYVAKIYRMDSNTDQAILQVIDPDWKPTYAAKLAPEGYKVKRGETIFIVGNPGIEFDNSITEGIVSATERSLEFERGKKVRVFQTDAVAIGGNSGGSVLNTKGEIIGTLSAGLRGASITFVVPIEGVHRMLRGGATGQRSTQGDPKPYQYGPRDGKGDKLPVDTLEMRYGWRELFLRMLGAI